MTISINGQPAAGAYVSVDGLARALGRDGERVVAELARARVTYEHDRGTRWVPADQPKVATLVREAVGSPELHTAEDAAKQLKVKPNVTHAAIEGVDTLFATQFFQPVETLAAFRSSPQLRAAGVAKVPGIGARLGVLAVNWGVPAGVAGAATFAVGSRFAAKIGDPLEPTSQRRTRRTGALIGIGAAGTAVAGLTALANGRAAQALPMAPSFLHTTVNRGIVGVALGSAALGAYGVASHLSRGDAPAAQEASA